MVELLLADSYARKATLQNPNTITISGAQVPVAKPEHLAALKFEAITDNPSRKSKDMSDVLAIIDAIEDPGTREEIRKTAVSLL